MELNTIYQGSALPVLKTFPDESIDMCVTSPPYWGLRSYGTTPEIWDGDEDCEHEFEIKRYQNPGASGSVTNAIVGNNIKQLTKFNITEGFCQKCGAWRGELGLEPDFNLYISEVI